MGTKARLLSAEALSRSLTRPQVPAPPPWLMRQRFRVTSHVSHGMPMVVVAPRSRASHHQVLYLHGGAYVHEVTGPHWRLIQGLVQRTGATVHVPTYPLAPRHTWASAFPPLRALARDMVAANGAAWTFMGDSAGGGLALALAQEMRNAAESLPGRIVLLSPWLDVATDHPDQAAYAGKDRLLAAPGLQWAGRQWAGQLPLDDPRISPLHGSLVGLPAIAVLAGTSDLLYVDALRLQDIAARSGHPVQFMSYPDMFHVWMAAPIPEAEQALNDVASFVCAAS